MISPLQIKSNLFKKMLFQHIFFLPIPPSIINHLHINFRRGRVKKRKRKKTQINFWCAIAEDEWGHCKQPWGGAVGSRGCESLTRGCRWQTYCLLGHSTLLSPPLSFTHLVFFIFFYFHVKLTKYKAFLCLLVTNNFKIDK